MPVAQPAVVRVLVDDVREFKDGRNAVVLRPMDPKEIAMPDPNDDSLTIALKLVMDVSHLRSLVDNQRLRAADEVAVQRLRHCLDDMDRRLVLLRGDLLQDPTASVSRRWGPSETDRANPYRRGDTQGSTEFEGLASLSDEDLLEHTRYWYWRQRHATDGFQRWNISKRLINAQDAVVSRGYGPLEWMDGTEGATDEP